MQTSRIPRGVRASLALIVAVCVTFAAMTTMAAGPGASVDGATIHDDETVYQTAYADGTPRDTVVVDWIRVDGGGTFDVLDPGAVTTAEALEDEVTPTMEPDGVRWALNVDGRRDFFYRAETAKELPIGVKVDYRLDGVSVEPSAVAGASGHLEIDVTVTNKLERSEQLDFVDADGVQRSREVTYCVPMLTPVKIDLDGTKFSNIEGDATIVSVTGSTRSYTFMTFPQPEQTITIEMDGSDIEIAPIVVSVFPKLASEPDFSVTDGLGELRDGLEGLSKLSSGHYQVVDGIVSGMQGQDYSAVAGASEGFAQLAEGMNQLQAGTDGLGQLTAGQIQYLDGLIAGIDSDDFSQVAQLPTALDELASGLGDLKTGVDGMVTLLDGQIQYLDGLAASNAALKASAHQMTDAASDDATLSAMAAGIEYGLANEGDMIAALRDGDEAMGLPYGLTYTRAQLAAISDGLGQTLLGLQQIATGAQGLTALPGQFEQLKSALVTLRDGGVVYGTEMPGLVTTRDSLSGISDGIGQAGDGVETAAEELTALDELPTMLGDLESTLVALKDGGQLAGVDMPGISTTVDGLTAAADGLKGGIDDAEFGKAVIARMKEAAATYDTFLGKPTGATGAVRFIVRIDGIEKPAAK
ncbi:MAG: hypothetical protein D9V44_08450 [Actinobacteria bacterium]|nr:MAG: hypothetical protein D9V44_08450 [Actinomycetota bacterium]